MIDNLNQHLNRLQFSHRHRRTVGVKVPSHDGLGSQFRYGAWIHKHESQHGVALHENAMVAIPPPIMEKWDSKSRP